MSHNNILPFHSNVSTGHSSKLKSQLFNSQLSKSQLPKVKKDEGCKSLRGSEWTQIPWRLSPLVEFSESEFNLLEINFPEATVRAMAEAALIAARDAHLQATTGNGTQH